jgi:membrane fusion protein
MSSLFRPEALAGSTERAFGEVRLTRPLALSLLCAVATLMAVAVAVWLVLGQYTRKVHVSGMLVPDRGLIRLMAPQSARVVERRVAEGAAVHAGDVLFVLSLERDTRGGETQERIQRGLAMRQDSIAESLRTERSLLDEQDRALGKRLDQARRELVELDAEARLQGERLALAEAAHSRTQALLDEHFVSTAQLQSRADEVLAVRAQVRALERQRAALTRELAVIDGQRRELPLTSRSREADLTRTLAELDQERAQSDARREVLVRAPRDGTLSAVVAEPGQWVAPDVALASVLPADARLQAHLFAPSSAVGLLKADQPVQLRVAAFPYQKFGHQIGRIVRISGVPLQESELAGLALAGPRPGEPLYRITVVLERAQVTAFGQQRPLVTGMQVDADVLLERRSLIEWVFQPLIGLSQRV